MSLGLGKCGCRDLGKLNPKIWVPLKGQAARAVIVADQN